MSRAAVAVGRSLASGRKDLEEPRRSRFGRPPSTYSHPSFRPNLPEQTLKLSSPLSADLIQDFRPEHPDASFYTGLARESRRKTPRNPLDLARPGSAVPSVRE